MGNVSDFWHYHGLLFRLCARGRRKEKIMSSTPEIILILLQTLLFVVLYFFLGFGPGFVIGILIANRLFAPGQATYMEVHEEKKKAAAQHNAQWHPTHERWQ